MDFPQRDVEPEWTDEEAAVDSLLERLYGEASIPEYLVERVWTRSCSRLSNNSSDLKNQMKEAFTPSSSEAISERIFVASVKSLPKNEKETVLARIGFVSHFRQIAIAATLILTTVVAMQFDAFKSQQPTAPQSREFYAEIRIADEDDYLLDSIELGDYVYLTEVDSKEFAYADIATSFNSVRDDIELWQSGLLFE